MSSGLVVFTSDFHLDKLSNVIKDGADIAYQTEEIRKPFMYAVEHGIPDIVIGGDVFHSHKTSDKAVVAIIDVIAQFDGHLRIWIIPGNHDVENRESHSLESLLTLINRKKFKTTNVFLQPEIVTLNGVTFLFLPFPYTNEYSDRPCVRVAHFEWSGSIMDNGKRSLSDTVIDVEGGFWLMGHLHTPQYLKKHRVLYCGTLYQTNFAENEDKSFCVCKFSTDASGLSGKFKRIASMQKKILRTIDVRSNEDLDTVPKSKNTILKLRVRHDVIMPVNFVAEHPNIASIIGAPVEEDEETLKIERNRSGDIRLTSLFDYMRNKKDKDDDFLLGCWDVLEEMGLVKEPRYEDILRLPDDLKEKLSKRN